MRSTRLVSTVMLLQARGRMTARELARELEVSVRTVYRDVDALIAAGVPVYAEQGPAGGYRLVEGYRTRLTGLTEPEALALFLVGLPAPAAALGLTEQTEAAELKLLAALGPRQRDQASRLRDRFHLDVPPWYREAETSPFLPGLADAVLQDRAVRVRYRRWEEPREVTRMLDPLGLVLKNGVWYVVARDRRRGTPRSYRVSNVLALALTDRRFARPDGFDLAAYWETSLAEFDARRHTGTAVIRLSPDLVTRLPDLADRVLSDAVASDLAAVSPAGWREVEIPIESVGHAATHLIRYADQVEVMAPHELRDELRRLARSLLSVYAD